jgi:hypothetical protein
MKKNFPYILIFIILALAAGAFVWNKSKKEDSTSNPEKTIFQNPKSTSQPQKNKETSFSYTHPLFGFTFSLPEKFSTGTFPEGEGEMLMVKLTGEQNRQTQIYVTDFGEPGPLTAQRISKDLPDMAVEQPVDILVNGEQAVAFVSTSGAGEKTREVWFVHAGHLYQISSILQSEKMASDMLSSWKWE